LMAAGGRSLFISMHGGGGAPAAINDSQWRNQVALGKAYAPGEGLYVAPRAPTDTWNLWHEAHIDPLFDRLISNLVILGEVNPDRVYLMGYSAGGDGVFQLAPRLSDRWAAAAMMAGHPNETSSKGLRNVPFYLQVGRLDTAFRRNEIAAEWQTKLTKLRTADPLGYEHQVVIHENKPHWMDLADRPAVPWMEKHTRQPHPEKIVWVQDDVLHDRSYWIGLDQAHAKKGQIITAERKGQYFTIAAPEIPSVRLYLNDALCDLDQPLRITLNGKEITPPQPQRALKALWQTIQSRPDPRLLCSVVLTVE
jgi:dienelactone hydrolase